jgi:hypothetical protein
MRCDLGTKGWKILEGRPWVKSSAGSSVSGSCQMGDRVAPGHRDFVARPVLHVNGANCA